ncbi:MAG: bifunctional nicotinamidase/pyrazinamidase [Acidobacteria bacterium]|nr:bifunctional nicotinamidase/pyrazinamidase [Acidobacteriota bacterium]
MDALIIVDVQHDFLPGGTLAVQKGDEVIPVINELIPRFEHVIATQDWHPADHLSFASQHQGRSIGDVIMLRGLEQVLWPDHCVQGTKGASFALDLPERAVVFRKGTQRHIDSYSGFFDNGHLADTGLERYLRAKGVDQLFITGLATDYCVKFTALDAISSGFKTVVISDATRAVDLREGDGAAALAELKQRGALISSFAECVG